jgi:transcriptional regulator with XRE-family HTH domain
LQISRPQSREQIVHHVERLPVTSTEGRAKLCRQDSWQGVDEHFMAGQKTDQRDVYVGQRIAEQRRKASLTQRRVAQSFGMSAAQLQKYEKGTNRISAVHLDIFSRMTGVPMDYFFKGMPRNDDFIAPGFSEREQSTLSEAGLKGLAEVVGRHITENFSEEARRDVADAIRALESKLGG